MLKELIWKLMGNQARKKYKQLLFRHTKRYKTFRNRTRDELAYLLLDTPRHGNLGDQAIVLAESDFMMKHFPKAVFYEFSYEECKYCIDDIYRYTSENYDTIIIPGGGFIGSLWMNEHLNVLQILRVFKAYKIVIFPQTIYFESSIEGERLAGELESYLLACKDVTIFARDEQSYEWLNKHLEGKKNIKYSFVPDIVTSLQHGIELLERKKEVLVCMRKDLEKISLDNGLSQIISWLREQGYSIVKTDTVLDKTIDMENRRELVLWKLKQFSSCSLVITDRLHGMIFSAITSTPCIALDNISKKVSGGYEWLKYLDYIKVMQQEELTIESIEQLLNYAGEGYSNKPLEKYYEQIRDMLEGTL